MLKPKKVYQFLPFAIILLGLIFAGFVSFLLATKPEQTENKVLGITQVANTVSPTIKPTSLPIKHKVKVNNTPFSTITPSPIPDPVFNASTPTPTVSSSPSFNPQMNQINVSINNSANFTISVTDGANQCEVLSKSLSEGKISSLNMKYDSRYNSYAVYQINGIGKETSVWWTFSVNGSNPPQGCSQVKANNNDNAVWTYIGPS